MSDKKSSVVLLDRLQETLLKIGDTNEKIADRLGCDHSTINKWYNGKLTPSLDKVVTICEKAKVSIDYLCGFRDEPTNNAKISDICDYIGLRSETIQKLHYLNEHNILKCSYENFNFYSENLSDYEFKKLDEGKLDISKTYQDIRMSELFNSLIQYIVGNAQIFLNTMELADNGKLNLETHKTEYDQKNLNANLYELTTKYNKLLIDILGIDDMFK